MEYKYIFHLVSGQSYVVTASKPIDLAALTSHPWFFINEWSTSLFCNDGGVALNTDHIEFIEVYIIDKK